MWPFKYCVTLGAVCYKKAKALWSLTWHLLYGGKAGHTGITLETAELGSSVAFVLVWFFFSLLQVSLLFSLLSKQSGGMPSHMVQRTSVSEKWRPEREREGGGGGARGLTLIQKTKGGEERTGEHAERWKGEEGEWQDLSWGDHPFCRSAEVRLSRGIREIVTYRCTCFRARMHTNTLGMVTETYINNVAERNRMQFLPYIRVYRRLARSEQPLSFSALPSGWMHTRFLELINHHICLPNNFNR